MTAPLNNTTNLSRWCRTHAGPLGLCVLYGLVISVLPHLLWWSQNGGPYWIGSNDELVSYFPLASQSYFNHPFQLTDPTFASGGISMFPRLLFTPSIVLAKLFHLGPLGVGLMWRLWAGATMAFGLYALLHHFLRRPWLAAGGAILLLSDAGVMWGRLLLNHTLLTVQTLRPHIAEAFFEQNSMLLLQWRVITPALSWGFLFLHLWLLARAKDKPDKTRLLLSGLGYGLLFPAYFYYWTAASAALVLAWIWDVPHRRVYFHTAWIGGLIGLPEVLKGSVIKHTFGVEWLYRTDKFVTIPRFSELHYSKLGILLLILTGFGILWRYRELRYVWLLAVVATALENHQIITGLQIENFHWEYVHGIALSVMLAIIVGKSIAKRPLVSSRPVYILLSLCAVHAALGLYFRALEATRCHQVRALQAAYHHYREQRTSRPNTLALAPNAVVSGDSGFVDFASILENQRPLERTAFLSPTISTEEWDKRVTLNSVLQGTQRDAFVREQEALLTGTAPGPWKRYPAMRAIRIAHRLSVYDLMTAHPNAAADQFQVRYVALPVAQAEPGYLRSGWRKLEAGPYWQLWERQLNSLP